MYIGIDVKYLLFLSYFNENSIFLNRFSGGKKSQILNFTKIHPVGAELFREDGRTDRCDEANP